MVIADFGRWPSSTMPCHHSDAACQRAGFISDRAVQADRQCEVYRASDNMEFMFRLLANFNFAATMADIAGPPRDYYPLPHDEAHPLGHDGTNIMDHAAALTAQHAHHFLV